MSQINDNKVRPISAITRTSSIQSSISTIPNEVEEGINISDSAVSLERTRENEVTAISLSSPTISHESEECQDQEGRINSVASSGHLFCKKNIF